MKFDLTQEEANEIKEALMGVVRRCRFYYEENGIVPPVGLDILPEAAKLLLEVGCQ